MKLRDVHLHDWLPHPIGWIVAFAVLVVAWCCLPARWFDHWKKELL